jgi:hypothetical protein
LIHGKRVRVVRAKLEKTRDAAVVLPRMAKPDSLGTEEINTCRAGFGYGFGYVSRAQLPGLMPHADAE